jgi:cation transport protein ChaC
VTQRSFEDGDLRPTGIDGQLTREDFTPERVHAYQTLTAQFGGGPGMSDEAREQSRQEILSKHDRSKSLWIFGYGSLMWNPAIHIADSRRARIEGFERRFALRLLFGRAMPERQGLMMCLVPGGHCHGVAHCLEPEKIESETSILWMREMLSGSYIPTWVDLQFPDGRARGITFVINPSNPRYVPGLGADEKAALIATAEGPLGTNRDYLFRTADALAANGLRDPYIDDMLARVRTVISADKQAGE